MIIGFILAVIALGLFLYVNANKDMPSSKRTPLIVVALIVGTFAVMKISSGGGLNPKTLEKILVKYDEVAGEMLGEHLAKTCPGESVLVLLPAVGETEKAQAANMLLGLRKGLGSAVIKEVVCEPDAEAKKSQDQMYEDLLASGVDVTREEFEAEVGSYLSPAVFGKCLSANGDCSVVVTFAGLPTNREERGVVPCDEMKGRNIAVAGKIIPGMGYYIGKDCVVAAVIENPDGLNAWPKGNDVDKIFPVRWYLVTKENLEMVQDKIKRKL